MKSLIVIALVLANVAAFTTLSNFGMESQVARQMIFTIESRMSCMFEPLEQGMFLKIKVQPYPLIKSRFPLQARLTSPSGEYSEWAEGDGSLRLLHNTTESGPYEICLFASRPHQILLDLFFHHPEKAEKGLQQFLENHQLDKDIQKRVQRLFNLVYNILYSVKYYNMASFGDEKLQLKIMDYIQTFSLSFMFIFIFVAVINVILVRRMFNVNTQRIQI